MSLKTLPAITIHKRRCLGTLSLFLRIIVKDPQGQVTYDTGRQRAHSFVKQFQDIMYSIFGDTDYASTNTSNVSKTLDTSRDAELRARLDALIFVDDYGVVVGSGTSAESNTDYKLATQIVDGTGSGELLHGATTLQLPDIIGGNVDYILNRVFTNNSGDTVTIAEVGVYASSYCTDGQQYFCWIRDVLGSSVDVLNGYTATVQYTLRSNAPGYVQQFLKWLYALNSMLDTAITDTSNQSRTIMLSSSPIGDCISALATYSTYGIVVGTGTDAVSNTQYALQTQIAHGMGSGEMQYGAVSVNPPNIVGDNIEITVNRSLVNSSGDTITIEEIGIYFLVYDKSSGSRYIMALRDLDTKAVLNTQTYTVIYTLYVSVTA